MTNHTAENKRSYAVLNNLFVFVSLFPYKRYKYFNTDNCNYNGDTPLHIAAANGKLEDVIHLLDELKAGIFIRNRYVVTSHTCRKQKKCQFRRFKIIQTS